MSFNPIIPVIVMAILCVGLLFFRREGLWNYIRYVLIVVLIFLINLRPMVPSDKIEVVSSNVDVLFVIDNTISMLAEDYGPDNSPRLDGVKEHVNLIMDLFPDSRYSVVTFDDKTQTLVNYTNEKDIVNLAVKNLDGQSTYYAKGTTINIAYDILKTSLKASEKQEEDEDNTETTKDRVQVVVFISDGEDNQDRKLRDFSNLADYIDVGVVLGYGTKEGGPMNARSASYDDTRDYVKYYGDDYSLKTAISRIDEDNLEKIADDLELEYCHVKKSSDVENAIDDLKDDIEDVEYERAFKSGEGHLEIYFILAMILGALVVYDFAYYRLKLSKEG